MRYRNIKTGAEFETQSKISAPNWIQVEADQKGEEPTVAPPSLKKTETKKSAPGKKGAKK